MKVRYGISKSVRPPHQRTRIVGENHSCVLREGTRHYSTLRKMLDLVARKHPGWSLAGFVSEEE